MKKLILSFVLSIFTGYITANNFVQQIQQYGDNGDFHRMDSIYSLAKLLQKSEMRKDIVIELSYKGFS